MSDQDKDLYSISEAARAWGISRQAVYKRLSTIDNQVDNQACIVVIGKKRYITRDCIELYREDVNQVDNQVTTKRQPNDNQLTTEVDRLTTEVDNLKSALLEEKGRAAALQATIDAQKAHIDSLQAALDKTQTALNQEQTLHLTTMQRLPAGRGRGFMEWLRGGKKEGQHGR